MQNKRRWLPRWQRIELVELCLEQGLTRRQAAAWRRVSVSTVQYWVQRYRRAAEADGRLGLGLMTGPLRRTASHCSPASGRMTGSVKCASARAGGQG